jgi:hypothetical protein
MLETKGGTPEDSAAIDGVTLPETPQALLARAKRLNTEQEWNTIAVSSPHAGTARFTPANAEFGTLHSDDFFLRYALTGVCSESLKTPEDLSDGRPANLWLSEYETPDCAMRIAFLRSGTLPRYGEQNEEIRKAKSTIAASEVLWAASLAVPSGRLVSIDLQSPGETNSHFEVEDAAICEQASALEAAARGGRAPVILNIPVHGRSYRGGPGWTVVAGQRDIIEEIADRALATDTLYAPRVAAELRTLLNHEAAARATPLERYALAARVALLACLGGDLPYINCRSGKDRTGFLDVEIKFLAYQSMRALLGEQVSDPGGAVLETELSAWKFLLLEGGNGGIQRMNTGYPGYKLNDPLLKVRVGADCWEKFLGQSALARV